MLITASPAAPRVAEPNPLLRLVAGDFAAPVAQLWPAPHVAYLAMPAQRRHLAHIALMFARAVDEDLADALVHARADAVLRAHVWDMPPGFVRSLGRIGELAWADADYLALIDLFEHEGAAQFLRQTPAITAERVRALAALAAPLRAPAIVRHLADPAGAALVDEVWRAIASVRGEVAAARAVERWARAGDASRLYQMAAAELAPIRFDLAPFPEHPDLRRLDGTAALVDAGRRFRNCLATYRERAADGSLALYEWAGPPPAALALGRDAFFGWRLEEARGVGNAVLDDEARSGLTGVLRSVGVRVGRSGRDLIDRLLRAAGQPHAWIDDTETELTAFGL